MPFTRPSGVLCSGYVYPDKKNTYEKLKEFLFDGTSGRTDVVFLCSAVSGYEPTQDTHAANPDAYHYTGGLVDGIAKAIIKGSATRTPRPLYATGVQFAYTCNKIPNFDRWNSGTWFTANTTGVGGFLTGCSTVYDSYYYYIQNLVSTGTTANSNTGFYPISGDNSLTYSYFDAFDTGGLITLPNSSLWFYAAQDPNNPSVTASSKGLKFLHLLSDGLQSSYSNAVRDEALSSTETFKSTFTATPEQPQRYWDRENSWYINQDAIFTIGIAYVNPTTNIIEEIFPDATTYGYVPAGLTVGMDINAAKALLAAGKLQEVYYRSSGGNVFAFRLSSNALVVNEQQWATKATGTPATQEYDTALASRFGSKTILARLLTVNEIITIRSLSIAANNSAITSYTAWKNVDGFRVGSYVVFRSSWANPMTLAPLTGANTFITNVVDKKFGLATTTDPSVSSWQVGLPYLFQWGNRPTFLSTNAWDLIDFSIAQSSVTIDGPSGSQLLGFPKSLSTIAPCGFFRLSSSDTSKLTNTGYTKYRLRGIVIKPNLGKFFTSITTDGSLQNAANSGFLTNAEKDASLGIFKSNNFKYCVNSYTIDKYSGDNISSTSGMRLTAAYKTVTANAYTDLTPSLITNTNPVVPNTQRRTIQRKNNILNVNWSAVNANWDVKEFHLGFLGRDVTLPDQAPTQGDMLLTTHFGIDANNQHGIAFSKLDTTYAYRSGDAAYQNDAGYVSGNRAGLYAEFFKAIYERQTSSSLFNAVASVTPKLVIMIETGIWELANPNFSYNGFNTWSYYADELAEIGAQSTGRTGSNFGFDALTPIINAAIVSGFTREQIVVCFYTPTKVTRTDIASKGTANGVTLNTELEENTFIGDKNARGTFNRASEIFVQNNLTYRGGLYTPSSPAQALSFNIAPNTVNNAAKNSVYINMGNITSITNMLNNITGYEATWYDTTDDILTYRYYSQQGALALGSLLMDYIAAEVSASYFVPPWVLSYSRQLNYTLDPVSGADLNLVTVSLDPVDIEPYLFEYDLQCDANNIQAKRVLSKFKTKILQ